MVAYGSIANRLGEWTDGNNHHLLDSVSSCSPHCMADQGNSERATHNSILLRLFSSDIATAALAEYSTPSPLPSPLVLRSVRRCRELNIAWPCG
jgi:hypothetical protein